MKSIVTTGGRTNDVFVKRAKEIAIELSLPYVNRQKKSVQKLQDEFQANIVVVSKERLELYSYGSNAPFFFHPNSAAFRMKRLLNGEQDLFLQATGLQNGDRFLDTTAGLCSDSIIAAYAVGENGLVHACEKDDLVSYIVRQGLNSYETDATELLNSMRSVKLVHQDAMEFLKNTETDSYDVVYMDPMFEEVIEESTNFQALREAGVHQGLTDEWVEEAKRVAKRRVVLKAHFRSPLFEQYHFKQLTRLTSKFHYGILEYTALRMKYIIDYQRLALSNEKAAIVTACSP